MAWGFYKAYVEYEDFGMQPLDVKQLPCFIHVTGTQWGKYIKFEFSIGDPELAVEMIRYSQSAHPIEFEQANLQELEKQ